MRTASGSSTPPRPHRIETSNISSTHRLSTPSLASEKKCCVDRLRPPPKADIGGSGLLSCKLTPEPRFVSRKFRALPELRLMRNPHDTTSPRSHTPPPVMRRLLPRKVK